METKLLAAVGVNPVATRVGALLTTLDAAERLVKLVLFRIALVHDALDVYPVTQTSTFAPPRGNGRVVVVYVGIVHSQHSFVPGSTPAHVISGVRAST